MDDATARELIALNNRFYAEHAASFDATRQAPWTGWKRLVELLGERDFAGAGDRPVSAGDAETDASTGGAGGGESDAPASAPAAGSLPTAAPAAGAAPAAAALPTAAPAHVLDMACGNLRFERFLGDALSEAPFEFHAVDACPALAAGAADGLGGLRFWQVDVLAALLAGGSPLPRDVPPADLAVCFGFMHHVPGVALRRALVEALVGATAPGGLIALSFWQFMNEARLAAKAAAADRAAATTAPPWPGFAPAVLDAGDHFLGWQDDQRPLRYCHHFTEAEIDELAAYAAAAGAREFARYRADGASGTLNRYLVLERR